MSFGEQDISDLRHRATRWAEIMDERHGRNALAELESVITSPRTAPYARFAAIATRSALMRLQQERQSAAGSAIMPYVPPRFLGFGRMATRLKIAFWLPDRSRQTAR